MSIYKSETQKYRSLNEAVNSVVNVPLTESAGISRGKQAIRNKNENQYYVVYKSTDPNSKKGFSVSYAGADYDFAKKRFNDLKKYEHAKDVQIWDYKIAVKRKKELNYSPTVHNNWKTGVNRTSNSMSNDRSQKQYQMKMKLTNGNFTHVIVSKNLYGKMEITSYHKSEQEAKNNIKWKTLEKIRKVDAKLIKKFTSGI